VFLAPVQVGGSTAFTLISGNSMEPLLHRGNLAAIRVGTVPEVGDVALYESRELGRGVLHRVIAVEDEVLTFQGDNNDFVDPEEVPMDAVVGTMWFHAPHVGSVMEWLRTPSHAALIAAGVAAFAIVGLFGGRQVRRERQRSKPAHTRTARPPRQPLGGWPPVVIALFVIVGIGGVAFASPLRTAKPKADAFRHDGSFSYDARIVRPNDAFPTGHATTGQPVIFSLADNVDLTFDYRFSSPLPHDVAGSMVMKAYVSDSTGWQEVFDLGDPVTFDDDEGQLEARFPLAPLKAFGEQLAENSDQPTTEYSVFLQPTVEVSGTVDGQPMASTFSPALPVLVTSTLIRVNTPAINGPPGTDVIAAVDVLRPTEPGTALVDAPGTVRLARYEVPVRTLRAVAVGLLATWALVVCVLLILQRRRQDLSLVETAAASGALVVPVTSLEGIADRADVEVGSFEILLRLALDRDVPLLVEVNGPHARYVAIVDGTPFHYDELDLDPDRLAIGPGSDDPPPPSSPPMSSGGDGFDVPSPRRMAKLGMLGAPFLVVGSAVMSFTAAGVVPTSRLGVTRSTPAAAQMAPIACSLLGVTRLVAGTSVSGTPVSELVLGKPANNGTLNGGAGNDCIIGPGGRRTTLNGGDGIDVCISPSSANPSFVSCELPLRPSG
jgi:signal peptidase I